MEKKICSSCGGRGYFLNPEPFKSLVSDKRRCGKCKGLGYINVNTSEDQTPVTWDGMAKFMTIFDGHDSLTKDEIHEFGAGRGYSGHQINGIMENLLDHGYIHEPIKDHFKVIRRIE